MAGMISEEMPNVILVRNIIFIFTNLTISVYILTRCFHIPTLSAFSKSSSFKFILKILISENKFEKMRLFSSLSVVSIYEQNKNSFSEERSLLSIQSYLVGICRCS